MGLGNIPPAPPVASGSGSGGGGGSCGGVTTPWGQNISEGAAGHTASLLNDAFPDEFHVLQPFVDNGQLVRGGDIETANALGGLVSFNISKN
jgi:hypothetical protein